MTRRTYQRYVKTQGGQKQWPQFGQIWKDLKCLDVGKIYCAIGDEDDKGRRVGIKDTIRIVLQNKVLGPFIKVGLEGKNHLDITISGTFK